MEPHPRALLCPPTCSSLCGHPAPETRLQLARMVMSFTLGKGSQEAWETEEIQHQLLLRTPVGLALHKRLLRHSAHQDRVQARAFKAYSQVRRRGGFTSPVASQAPL